MALENFDQAYAQLRWDVGMRMRALRKINGMTETRMAETFGIPRATYHNYEIGRAFPTVPLAMGICSKFDVDQNWLFGGDYTKIRGDIAVKLMALILKFPKAPPASQDEADDMEEDE